MAPEDGGAVKLMVAIRGLSTGKAGAGDGSSSPKKIPSGERLQETMEHYGTSPCFMGKSTIKSINGHFQ